MVMPVLPILIATSLGFSQEIQSDLEHQFLERARALAADDACELFSEDERTALDRSLERIVADLERSGLSADTIAVAQSRIRTDRALSFCDSNEVRQIAARYRAAYANYLQQPSHNFEGAYRSWTADRTKYEFVRWNLFQDVDGGRFGQARLSTEEDAPYHIAFAWQGDEKPAMTSLVLRDVAREPDPVDATAGGFLPLPDNKPVARYQPPRYAQTHILASSRGLNASPQGLFGAEDDSPSSRIQIVTFPDTLIEHLAELEPEESVRLEMKNSNGEMMAQYWIEVGQLRHAIDFLALEYKPFG